MIKYICTICLSLFVFFSSVNCSESAIDDVVENINVYNSSLQFKEYEINFEENFQEYKDSIYQFPTSLLNINEDIVVSRQQYCNTETQDIQRFSRNLSGQPDEVGQKRNQMSLKETSPPFKVPCIAIKDAEDSYLDVDILNKMIPKILKTAINPDVTKKSWKNLSIKLKSMWDPYNERSFDAFFLRLVEFIKKRNLYKEFESSLTNISKSVKFKKNAKNNEQVMKNIKCFLNKKSVNKMNYEQCVQLAHRIKTIWDIKNTKTFGGLYKALSTESKKLSSNIELSDKMKIIACVSDKQQRNNYIFH